MKNIKLGKTLILLNSLLLSIMVCAAAWFIFTQETSTQGLHMQTTEAINVVISASKGEKWTNDLSIDLGDSVFIRETTGDGKTFFSPVYAGTEILSYRPNLRSDSFIEQTFLLKADSTIDIYLSPTSYIRPKSGAQKDYIAGAVRVAFFEITPSGDEELIYIWAPNPRYEFNGTSVNPNGQVESTYSYITSTDMDETIYPTLGEAAGISDDTLFVWGDQSDLTKTKPLLMIATQDKNEVEHEILVRLWVEGTDRECTSALRGGTFSVHLDFYYVKEGEEVSANP